MATLTCLGFVVFFQCDLPPAPPPVVVCPPLAQWSRAYQDRIADDIGRLQPGSALGQALREHIQLRDQIRKCRARPSARRR